MLELTTYYEKSKSLNKYLRLNWQCNNKSTNHNPIRMVALVRCNLGSNRKALQTKVKIWAHYTLNADSPGDIFVAIITVVQS